MIYATYPSKIGLYETAVISKIVCCNDTNIELTGLHVSLKIRVKSGMTYPICVDVNRNLFAGKIIAFIFDKEKLYIQSNGEELYRVSYDELI